MSKCSTLYAKSSGGKLITWNIWTEGDDIVTKWGEVGGKVLSNSVKSEGKNVGRSNETTPEEQAVKDAFAKWTKKLKGKYYLTEDGALNTLTIVPMKAYPMDDKRKAKIDGPVFVQRKLDGVRCFAYLRPDGSTRLMSYGGEDYDVPLVLAELEGNLKPGKVKDGELYVHGYALQDIRHMIAEKDPMIEFHVYDSTILEEKDKTPWKERWLNTVEWFGSTPGLKKIVQCDTVLISSIDQVQALHDEFVQEGYEGAIIRLPDGPYKMGSRSTKVLKLKAFDDDEFEIIGMVVGKDNVPQWVCLNEDGEEFKARAVGSAEFRAQLVKNFKKYVGQMLTVKYKGRSNDNKPLFPVGKGIRPQEDMG